MGLLVFGEIDKMNWVFSLITLVITYILATIIYRRTLHPLAHVPGPFLASITSLYEFYYDHIRGGQYFLRFDDFVARYGPVIRTGPDKVLLADPDHYDIVYNQHKPFEKAPRLYRTFALGEAMFVQSEPAKYKPQRAALNPFFSRRSVLSQEQMIKAKVAKLVQLVTDAGDKNPAPLHYGYRAMAIDVVTEYAFGPDICFNLLEREDMGESFDKQVRTTVEGAMHLSKAFPFLLHFLSLPLPESWTQKIDFMSSFRPPVRDGVSRVIDDVDNGIQPAVRTIYHELIEGCSGHTSMSRDISLRYLMDESFVIVGAAGDTTGNAMTQGTLQVLTHTAIYRRLHQELRAAFASAAEITVLELEKIPYVMGVVKEALRQSYGVITPLDRMVPPGGYTFNGIYLPEGVDVGMTTWLMHRNPLAFPHPTVFSPDRWIDISDPEQRAAMDKHMAAFSRGARSCLGQQLATAETYLALGILFWHFDDLYIHPQLSEKDMETVDYFSPQQQRHKPRMSVARSGSPRW